MEVIPVLLVPLLIYLAVTTAFTYISLMLIGVRESRTIRSILMSLVIAAAQVFTFAILYACSFEVGIPAAIVAAALVALFFFLFIRKLLRLKPWQYFAIPVLITIFTVVSIVVLLNVARIPGELEINQIG